MRFKHIHSSGKWNRSAASLERALDGWMDDADLITMTEVASKARGSRFAEKGWAYHVGNNGPKDDAGIAWRADRFREIFSESFKLSDKTHMIGGHRSSPVYGAFAVLHTNDGKIIVVAVAHLPSDVETDTYQRDTTLRTTAHRADAAGLRSHANKLAARFGADAIMIVADWNLNVKKLFVRAWFKTVFPLYRVTWTKPFPANGTHGQRIIDATLIKKKIRVFKKPHLLPHDPSSDHTPYEELLEV